MDESSMEEFLRNAIIADEEADEAISRIETFEEALLLTSNKGLVLTMKDGHQFQLTIVRRR